MPALSAKNVLNVEKTTSGEHFWRVRLGLSAGHLTVELFARPHNDPVIRISSNNRTVESQITQLFYIGL